MERNAFCSGCGHRIAIMFHVNLCNMCLTELAESDWVTNTSMGAKASKPPQFGRRAQSKPIQIVYDFRTESVYAQ